MVFPTALHYDVFGVPDQQPQLQTVEPLCSQWNYHVSGLPLHLSRHYYSDGAAWGHQQYDAHGDSGDILAVPAMVMLSRKSLSSASTWKEQCGRAFGDFLDAAESRSRANGVGVGAAGLATPGTLSHAEFGTSHSSRASRNAVTSRGVAGYDSLRASARGAIDRLSSWFSGGSGDADASVPAQEQVEDSPPSEQLAGPGGLPLGMFRRDDPQAFGAMAPVQAHSTFVMEETSTVCKNGRCHTVTKHIGPNVSPRGNILDMPLLPLPPPVLPGFGKHHSAAGDVPPPLMGGWQALEQRGGLASPGHFEGQTEAKW